MSYKGFFKITLGLLTLVVAGGVLLQSDEKSPKELHHYFLENSPYKETHKLSKKERLNAGLPPNKFHEQIYDLTMDPATGKHNYESKLEAQEQIARDISLARYAVPGESAATPWYEVGPKNAAGRSRAAVWHDGNQVIAGGVSGGLWKINDITDPSQNWVRMTGVPGNLAVSVIVQDPNDKNTLYVGTGESYTGGDASGNGIYKTTDGGTNWTTVFGRGATSTTVTSSIDGFGQTFVEGYFAVNDIILYDHDLNPGTDPQVFAAIGSSNFNRTASTFLDEDIYGLYKSADAGTTFSQITSVNNGSNSEEINDLEVQEVSNRIWLSTSSNSYGTNGGRFWYSDDGASFTQANPMFPTYPTSAPANRHRTEIASSRTNTDTHFILIETSDTSSSTSPNHRIPIIYKTTDNFLTFEYIVPPNDLDAAIPAYDFTRNQAFYDLEIEVDPDDDKIIYLGGINWFRSEDSGSSWSQITKWADQNGMQPVPSLVHADQHGLYFKPGDSDVAIVVNDGGVYYSSSLSTASKTATFFGREKNLITTQFYTVAQSPSDFSGADYIIGGTQDNGTWSILNSANNKTDGTEIQSGDGAASLFDQVGGHYYISNYVYNNAITRGEFDSSGNLTSRDFDFGNNLGIPDNEGDFINPAALDSNRDVYFSCAGNGNIRVITGLERNGVPDPFLIDFSGTSNSHATSLEVSRHTTNTSVLFIGLADGEVLKVSNAGDRNNYSISSVYSQAGSVSDIHFGETDNDIYVTYFNYGISNNIIYTDDGFATSPSSKEGDLPDFPVLSILHNPYQVGEVIVGTELGIWKTANFNTGSPNWVPAYTGMSDVAVYDMDFRGVDALNNRVVAASYGRGIYTGSFTSSNNPPVSATDSITVLEGGTAIALTNGATSVLSNDTDPETDPITASVVSTTINGVLALSGTGSFTYTHDGSETTTDTFTYRAFDGSVFGNIVAVSITVTPVNDCPLVQNPISNQAVTEDAADTNLDIASVFLDPEGSALTYTVTNTNPTLLSASLNTTTLTLDFSNNETGTATITLMASDSVCATVTSETFLVTVSTVNDLPIGIADTITLDEAGTATLTSATATSVLFNDTDIENAVLTTGVGFGAIAPSVAKGTLNFLDDGSFTYTHDGTQVPGDANTTDVFYYRPYDGSFGNTTTVTININHTNDCPIETNPISSFNAMEDDPDLDINIGSVFTDEELDALTLTVSSTNLALLSATLASATITIDYVNNMTGSSTIILYATDNDMNCTALVSSTFIITVIPQNDTPVGGPDTILVDEGGTVTSTTSSITVLANDSDMEGDPLTATILTYPLWHDTSGGAFTLQSSGTFEYVHDGSETVTDTFNYTLDDGTTSTVVSVTINITPVNDCPTIDTPLPDLNKNEDAADTVISLSPNYSDAENNPISFSVANANTALATVTLNTSTLTIQYIPEQSGTTTITVTLDDSNSCNTVQDIFVINVTAVNDSPQTVTDTLIVDEGGTVTTTTLGNSSLLTNDSDTESDPIEAQIVSMASNGIITLSTTGTFTYTHDGTETTTDTFQYRAAETAPGGMDGNTVTVNININEINDCPTLTTNPPISFTQNEDSSDWGYTYDQFITDEDGNTPMYTLTHTATSLLSAVITNQSDGTITFTPLPDQFGTTTMTLNANDGRGCDVDIIIPVTITPSNDCPTVVNNVADVSATEDDPDLYIPLAGIFDDVDNASTDFTYSTNIGDSSLIATSFTATALIIDFLPNQNGSTYINLIVSDGDMMCTIDDMFNVSILQTNDPPIGVAESISVTNGGTVSVLNDATTNSVLANDSDAENNPITATLVTSPTNGTLTLSSNGNFTYTHDGSATTTDSFIYTPRDSFSIGNTTTVTIYINELPVGVVETIALLEGASSTLTTDGNTSVLDNDTDTDPGDTALLTAVIETSPQYGTLVLNADGTFVYTHGGTEDFSDSFTYKPFDGKGYGILTVVSITVTPTNDPPIAVADQISVGLGLTTTLLSDGTNNVLQNDTDPDGDSLTATVVTNPNFGTLVLNPGGTFSYVQNGTMNSGDSFTYKANDGSLDSNIVTVNINLTCSPCTEYIIEAGSNGVLLSYQGCDCRNYDVYVPKGKSYIFCHLDNSISILQGSYTVLSSKVCN